MTNDHEKQTIQSIITGLEKAALERWNNGDPTGFLELSAPDVVYFDPFLDQRLSGLDELTSLYKSITGQVHVDRYEMLNQLVQATEKMAVLTFNLNSYLKETVQNGTVPKFTASKPMESGKLFRPTGR